MQITETTTREYCLEQDIIPGGGVYFCKFCKSIFEKEKFTDVAGSPDTRFVSCEGLSFVGHGDLPVIEKMASAGMEDKEQEVFIAFIEWIIQCYIPQEIVVKIAQEQKEYSGEGYLALQEFVCRNLDETKMPAFLTGIGVIEAAQQIVTSTGECSIDELDLIKGVMFCKQSIEDDVPF